MKKKLKLLLLILFSVQITTYFVFSDYLLQKQVESNFDKFNQRRFKNKWAKKTKHNKYILSSEGNRFFPNDLSFYELIKKTDSKNYWNCIIKDSNTNFHDLYNTQANDSTTVICFNASKRPFINVFTTKINQYEMFASHNDFHAMMYNKQIINRDIYYFWFLYKWFKIIDSKE